MNEYVEPLAGSNVPTSSRYLMVRLLQVNEKNSFAGAAATGGDGASLVTPGSNVALRLRPTRHARWSELKAAGRHLQRFGGNGIDRGRLQLVLSLDQRRIVLVLQQCEDRLGLEVVPRNFLP